MYTTRRVTMPWFKTAHISFACSLALSLLSLSKFAPDRQKITWCSQSYFDRCAVRFLLFNLLGFQISAKSFLLTFWNSSSICFLSAFDSSINWVQTLLVFTMPPFISTSKAVRSLITSRNAAKHLIRSAKNGHSKIDQIRCYSSSIFGISTPSLSEVINRKIDFSLALGSLYNNITVSQRRRFLGCGDGDEGGVLSKVYEERRVMG